MIYHHGTDLLDETHGIIVHGVNTMGLFNAGIARQIRHRFPTVYQDYMERYRRGSCQLGQIILTSITDELKIVSGFTQRELGRTPNVQYVDYKAIEEVFKNVNAVARHYNLPVKFPMIGAGLGGGDWNVISTLIDNALDESVVRICFKL